MPGQRVLGKYTIDVISGRVREGIKRIETDFGLLATDLERTQKSVEDWCAFFLVQSLVSVPSVFFFVSSQRTSACMTIACQIDDSLGRERLQIDTNLGEWRRFSLGLKLRPPSSAASSLADVGSIVVQSEYTNARADRLAKGVLL